MSETQIKLGEVRLSFPSLFKKAVFEGEETKFEATVLMEKDSKNHKITEAAIEKFIAQTFKDGAPKGLKITCFQDGDTKDVEGYEGMMALKGSSNKRIPVFDKDRSPITEEDDKVYAGCYVNAIFDFWFSSHPKGGKQILANLLGVQFKRDGETFSDAKVASADFFDDESEEDDF
jgi:hypothetical protein